MYQTQEAGRGENRMTGRKSIQCLANYKTFPAGQLYFDRSQNPLYETLPGPVRY